MSEDSTFRRNLWVVAGLHVALIGGVFFFGQCQAKKPAEQIVWMDGGAAGGGNDGGQPAAAAEPPAAAEEPPPEPPAEPPPKPEAPPEPPPKPEPPKPELVTPPEPMPESEIAQATPKPVTPPPLTPKPVTPKQITPKPITPKPVTPKPTTPKPTTPKPTKPKPTTPKPKPATPKPSTPKATPKAASKTTPNPKATPKADGDKKPTGTPSDKPKSPATASKSEGTNTSDNGAAVGGPGKSGKPGKPGNGKDPDKIGGPNVDTYHAMLHDRFHTRWEQPTSIVRTSTDFETTLRIRIANDGTISHREIIKSSGNPVMDESVLAGAQKVALVEPLSAGLGNGKFYEVSIVFKLDQGR